MGRRDREGRKAWEEEEGMEDGGGNLKAVP